MTTPSADESPSFLARSHPLARFAWGASLPFRAIGLIASSPVLRKWSMAAMALSGVFLLALLVLLVLYTGGIVGLVWSRPEGWWLLLWYPLAALVFSLLFVVGASTLPTIATAPLLDQLTVETERLLGVHVPDGNDFGALVREIAGSTGKALLRVSILLAGHLVLLLLWLIPGIGHAIWTGASLLWTVYWLAFEYLDLSANRYGYRFPEVAHAVAGHASASFGLGAALYVFLLVPLLNVVFIPVGAVAATLLFVELRRSGLISPSRRERQTAMELQPPNS